MPRLFIIGNGFDMAHDLKTSYDDFRSYLIENQDIEMDRLITPTPTQMPDGEISYKDSEVLSMLFYLISVAESNWEKWSNIEASLANLDFDEVFDDMPEILDKDGDTDYWKQSLNNEDLASNLKIPMLSLLGFLKKWIFTIDTSDTKIKKAFSKLLSEDDLFLNFNYTDTLEQVYSIPEENICYIHGRQFEKIYFGHGNTDDRTDEIMTKHIGAENHLTVIYDQLRKDTSEALNNNRPFFNGLADTEIHEIYSYGFSFSDVDTIYLTEICKKVDTSKVIWYFHDYDKSNIKQFSNVLFHCGYEGEFSTFSCK